MKAISLWVIIVCHNKDTGNMTQRGFCVLDYQPQKTCALGQQKWQVQRKLSSPREQSMEPLKTQFERVEFLLKTESGYLRDAGGT